jgi:hypothetical protein
LGSGAGDKTGGEKPNFFTYILNFLANIPQFNYSNPQFAYYGPDKLSFIVICFQIKINRVFNTSNITFFNLYQGEFKAR